MFIASANINTANKDKFSLKQVHLQRNYVDASEFTVKYTYCGVNEIHINIIEWIVKNKCKIRLSPYTFNYLVFQIKYSLLLTMLMLKHLQNNSPICLFISHPDYLLMSWSVYLPGITLVTDNQLWHEKNNLQRINLVFHPTQYLKHRWIPTHIP